MFGPLNIIHLKSLAYKVAGLKKDRSAQVFLELMSGGLMWEDEKAFNLSTYEMGYYRAILSIRTGFIIGKPDLRFPDMWEEFQKICPEWIGFDPSRCQPSKKLLEKYNSSKCRKGLGGGGK